MISVIMGAYNAEKTVARAIRSLYTSTEPIEVIVVDDCSRDGTAVVLADLQKTYPNLYVYTNEINRGLTYCLNFALAKSCGEFIARLDADDINRVGRFEAQAMFLREHPEYAFAGGNARLFDEGGVYARRRFPQIVRVDDLIRGNPFIHPSLLFRREALLQVEGYRDVPETVRCEDYDLMFRLYASGLYGYNMNTEVISYYEPRTGADKHSFRTRRNEFRVRRRGSKLLGSRKGKLLAVKPLLLSVIPKCLYRKLHQSKIEKWEEKKL